MNKKEKLQNRRRRRRRRAVVATNGAQTAVDGERASSKVSRIIHTLRRDPTTHTNTHANTHEA